MKLMYLDESNYLTYQEAPLAIGGWILDSKNVKRINGDLKEIKAKYGVKARTEVKWTKISLSKIELYKELVNYAINNENLKLRVVVSKSKKDIRLSFLEWYTRLHFTLWNRAPRKFSIDGVISDKKGSKAESTLNKTMEISLGASAPRIEFVDSKDSNLIQLTDIFLGAISNAEREIQSRAKTIIRDLIASKFIINESTSLFSKQTKYNIFYWRNK